MLSAESSLLIRRITAGPAGRRPATRPSKKLETAPFETAVAMSGPTRDRKSTRLNSSHSQISYAVFCLKKKNERGEPPTSAAELIDHTAPSPAFRSVASMANAPLHLNALLLPDRKVLITGGTSAGGLEH